MSQDKITFDEKSNNVSIVDRQKQVAAEDLNEIKEVVNNNADDADERISALEESQTSGTVTSVNDNEPDDEGNVSLTPDDLDDSETANKFVTADDIEKLGNTSGVNSGDQDLSNYFDKTADKVTEDLIEDGAVTDAKLSDSGVTSGTYYDTNRVTVNSQGRITSISSGTTVTEYNITSNNPTITCNLGILEKLYVTIDSSVTDMSETVWVTSWSNGNTLTSRGTIVINNETSLDLDLNLTYVNFENGLTSNYLFEPGVTRLYYNVSGGEVFYGLASGPDSPTERYEDLNNSSDIIDIDCKYKNNFVSSNRVTLSTATTITISNDDNLRFATFKYSATAGDTITFPTGSISADGNWSSLVWTAPETGYFTASIYKTGTEYEITFTQGGAI
jgi:hypothetical protein